jgi:tRNA G10  N-methylase Trm11
MQIAILGRQPKISLAELESLFGAEKVTPIGEYAALIDTPEPLPQARLGGTIKSAKLLTKLPSTTLEGAFRSLQSSIPEHLAYLPDGKLQFGVSIYGFKAQKNWLLRQMLELKKVIRKQGRSVRIIENKSEALETAQVLYNKLTSPLGWELLLIKDGPDVLLAQTTAVQDIDAYAARDFERPMRDAYVGMLPPKLAQIMLNLAVSGQSFELNSTDLDEANSKIQDPRSHTCVLDPFCGTGVVLQEAMLMQYSAYGTDLSEKMVRYTRENLNWLQETLHLQAQWYLEVADATKHTWRQPIDAVVCETYLGKPLTALPSATELDQIIHEADQIAEGFLKNIHPQLKSGTRLVLALPAWALKNATFRHLKVLDHLENLGYNRLDLVHAKKSDLLYHRENQVVARELTILEKI